MANIPEALSFLCGNFLSPLTATQIRKTDDRWRSEQLSADTRAKFCNIYYRGFVDTMVPLQDTETSAANGEVKTLYMDIGRPCHIRLTDREKYTFQVESIRIFLFPFDIKLFAIAIREQNTDFDQMMAAHYKLCRPSCYDSTGGMQEFCTLLKPLTQLRSTHPVTALPDYGNKLKIFQIIRTEHITDQLLYECGMLSSDGSAGNSHSRTAPASEYQQQTLEKHKLNVFNNWRALALLDTFTVLHKDLNKNDINRWTESYFRLIYIHALFTKTMLGIVNIRSRDTAVSPSVLAERFSDFEFRFLFHKISYNFLPQLLHDTLDRSLEIHDELNQTHEFMQRMTEAREKHRDRNLAKLILLLTVLTIFSILNDGQQFFSSLIEHSPSLCLLRWIGGILSGAVCLGVILVLFRWKRRK